MRSLIFRALVVWLVIMTAESLHGILRVALLQPRVGDFRARQIAVFSGIAIILAIAYLFARFLRAAGHLQLLAAGAVWVFLTVAFEITLGRLLGLSWERITSDYDLAHGGLMGLGLIVMLFAPLIATRLRRELQTS